MNRLYALLAILVLCLHNTYPQEKINESGRLSFNIATWNLGHFSNGAKPFSTINGAMFHEKVDEFNALVRDSLAVDVLCINEYSGVFGSDENGMKHYTKDFAIGDYKYGIEGPLTGYSSNAIFSKLKLKNVKIHSFECTKPFVGGLPRSSNYYWISGDLFVGKKKIRIVCAHTISSHGPLCAAMNVEIINKCCKYKSVILCGDWNSLDYTIFKQAGYTLANSGNIKTYPNKAYPLDNIMVRGIRISDVRLVKSILSDHYPLMCKIVVD